MTYAPISLPYEVTICRVLLEAGTVPVFLQNIQSIIIIPHTDKMDLFWFRGGSPKLSGSV